MLTADDRGRQERSSGTDFWLAITGFTLSVVTLAVGTFLANFERAGRGAHGIDGFGVALILVWSVPFALGFLLLALAINLTLVWYRYSGLTGRPYGLLGLLGLFMNAAALTVPLIIILGN